MGRAGRTAVLELLESLLELEAILPGRRNPGRFRLEGDRPTGAAACRLQHVLRVGVGGQV